MLQVKFHLSQDTALGFCSALLTLEITQCIRSTSLGFSYKTPYKFNFPWRWLPSSLLRDGFLDLSFFVSWECSDVDVGIHR